MELQRRLPNARVLYVSATGATECENLCYMERLGLWGPGTAYATKKAFVDMLRSNGVRESALCNDHMVQHHLPAAAGGATPQCAPLHLLRPQVRGSGRCQHQGSRPSLTQWRPTSHAYKESLTDTCLPHFPAGWCAGAMELVASELKQSGAYLARTLSYEVGPGLANALPAPSDPAPCHPATYLLTSGFIQALSGGAWSGRTPTVGPRPAWAW